MCNNGAGSDQRVFTNLGARKNGRMIGHANAVPDTRCGSGNPVDVVDVVGV